MDSKTMERFADANRELGEFLRKVDGLANGTELITEDDMLSVSRRLGALAPEIGGAWQLRGQDPERPNEVTNYVENLRALQTALESVRCVMLARKVQLDNEKRHFQGLQGWVNAYQQTT